MLVTGAARRIGAAIARAFHAAGANVAVHCHRSAKEGAALVAELNSVRAKSAELIRGDLDLPDTWTAVPATAIRVFGRLDVLVNNASTFYPTPVGEITPAQFDVSSALTARAALPPRGCLPMRRRQVDPHIADTRPAPLGSPPVTAPPIRARMLTRSLARERGPRSASTPSPGRCSFPRADVRRAQAHYIALLPGSAGSPDDIAKAALFFATAAPYVTGEVLAVDGGRLSGGEQR